MHIVDTINRYDLCYCRCDYTPRQTHAILSLTLFLFVTALLGILSVVPLSPVRARQASWSTWLPDWATVASASTTTSTRTFRSTPAPTLQTAMASFPSRRCVCGSVVFLSGSQGSESVLFDIETLSFFQGDIVMRPTPPPATTADGLHLHSVSNNFDVSCSGTRNGDIIFFFYNVCIMCSCCLLMKPLFPPCYFSTPSVCHDCLS